MTRAALIIVVVAMAAPARADNKAAAEAAFDQGTALADAGKYREACPLFEASYKADPQLGVLLNLADCHERIGRTATAWVEFRDAAVIASKRGDSREAYARRWIDALAPKLARLRVVASFPTIAGLVVRSDEVEITVMLGKDMPIDPGDHEVSASAPGYDAWTARITISAAPKTTEVAIPPLMKTPVAPEKKGALVVTTQSDAEIFIDARPVAANGHFEGRLKAGPHALRVAARGMRAQQSDVIVVENETRTIDVPLERELATTQEVVAPRPRTPLRFLAFVGGGVARVSPITITQCTSENQGGLGGAGSAAIAARRLLGSHADLKVSLGLEFAALGPTNSNPPCRLQSGHMFTTPLDVLIRWRPGAWSVGIGPELALLADAPIRVLLPSGETRTQTDKTFVVGPMLEIGRAFGDDETWEAGIRSVYALSQYSGSGKIGYMGLELHLGYAFW